MALFGLVLAGGESRRMGRDKSLLNFGQHNLADLAYTTLNAICEQTFISVSQHQFIAGLHINYPRISDSSDDQTDGMGPLGGILAAQQAWPDAAWLVLACDLPFVTSKLLERLLANRDCTALATFYRLTEPPVSRNAKSVLEPLCGIYESASHAVLAATARRGMYSLHRALEGLNIHVIDTQDPAPFANLNTQADYAEAIECLARPKKRLAP